MTIAWKKILCPVDFSEESRAALRVAVDLAGRFGAALTLFHADGGERTASEPQAAGTMGQWKIDAEKLGASGVAVETMAGDPRLVIADHAQKNGFDLVVMGTHGRTGRDRLLLGSVAENVVRSSRVPVLTVHVDFDKKG